MEDMRLESRADLAAFLRARRARLTPRDAGLPEVGPRRRTPGLRRQEVAQLAGMSVDYYIRLEQGRGPHPSRQVLSALARALMLTADEREYLFRMAGEARRPARPTREITPGLQAPARQHAGHPGLRGRRGIQRARLEPARDPLHRGPVRVRGPEHDPLDVPCGRRRGRLDRRRRRQFHPVHGRRPARRLRPLPGRSGHRQLVTEMLGSRRSSPRCGRRTRSKARADDQARRSPAGRARSSSSARSCTSPRPASG